MAAQSVVLDSYNEPIDTYATNVLGTVHILEALRHTNRSCSVVNVTSDKCYENVGSTVAYTEGDRLGGRDPYSNSKACSELVTSAYRDSYFGVDRSAERGVSVSTARAGNVIGGGDWTPWQLIPDVIRAFQADEKVTLRHPGAVRPWQHVLDCLGGYLTLAEKQAENPSKIVGGWNFGPSDDDIKPVSYIVNAIAAHWGLSEAWTVDEATYAHEEPTLVLDSAKARRELGWTPVLPLDTALKWVVDWYRGCMEQEEPRALCQRQIDEFLKLARSRYDPQIT
jgi:CDP-glucose 4,6-dehydratase